MKRTAIVGLNRINVTDFLIKNSTLLIATFLYIIGILVGTLLFRSNQTISAYAANIFNAFLSARQNTQFISIFFSSFLTGLIYFGAVFMTGTSVVGMLLSPCVLLFKGFIFGAVCSYLYVNFALKGIAFNAIIYIPCSVILSLGIILCCREAINFSLLLARLFTPKGQSTSMYTDFKRYCIKCVIILLLFVFSAIIDATMSKFFIGFFEF